MTGTLDIANNRKAVKYSRGEQVKRLLWALAQPLFRYSPRPCFAWRRMLLRLFGGRIGRKVNIYGSAIIYMPWNLEIGEYSSIGEHVFVYNLGRVRVGASVTVSLRAHICAGSHDYQDPAMELLKLPITILDQAWVGADAFIGPGVIVGEGAVVGARAVVVKDVEPWQIVAGNPARPVGTRVLDDAVGREREGG